MSLIHNATSPYTSSSSSYTAALYTAYTYYNKYFVPYVYGPAQYLLSSLMPLLPASLASYDIWGLIAIGVLTFVAFKILDYVRRMVMFWVRLAFKIMLVFVLVQVAVNVSQNGWDDTLNKIGWLWGVLEGWLGETGMLAQEAAGTGRGTGTGRKTGRTKTGGSTYRYPRYP